MARRRAGAGKNEVHAVLMRQAGRPLAVHRPVRQEADTGSQARARPPRSASPSTRRSARSISFDSEIEAVERLIATEALE